MRTPFITTDPEPSFWHTFGEVIAAVGLKLLLTAVIIVVTCLISVLLRLVIRRIVNRIVSGAKSKANVDDTRAIEASPLAQVRIVQRTRTLGTILQNITNIALVIIALILILNVLVPTALGSLALITAAVGAGLGFGAQNIVKDVLNGIFIVAEDQVGIGDVVDVGLATGVVEYVSVRITHVRDVNGTLWYVRNGEITRIGNMSQGWSRVILDIALPLDIDIAAVEQLLLETARGMRADPKWRTRILEQPEVWGLESVTGDTLVIRLVMKTRANAKDDVASELRMRVKAALQAQGIVPPALNSVVLTGVEGAQRVRGANPPKTKPTAVAPPPAARPVWKLRRGKGDAQSGATE
ncbi:MAG: mechanosensitive ion channel family protein [Microbacterium sp.]|uniref:mechanosensitive ion channel family protein n=1 Tax=Microbacterium sp. TaxID=51671 RepID=UPI003A8A6975